MMKMSGLKSILPAIGMYFLKKLNIGYVRLFKIGATGEYGFIQLKMACISTEYIKMVMLMLTTPINATASIANQMLLPAIHNGNPLSSRDNMVNTSCVI